MAELPCPNCGSPLAFLDQYQRLYCMRCGQYAPEGYGDRGARHCPTCGGILSYVSRYDRFYCYHCNLYAPEEPATAPNAATPSAESPPPPATQPVPATTPTAAIVPTPEAPLVAAATLETSPTAAPTQPEPVPTPTAPPEAKPATAEPTPSSASAAPGTTQPTAPVPQAPSPEILRLAASKPAIVRVKIFTLKKSELTDLCKAYGLDPSGTKEQVQERLLSYLHGLETEEPPEQPRVFAPVIEPASARSRVPETGPRPMVSQSTAAVVASSAAAVVQVEEPARAETPAQEALPATVEVSRAPAKIEHPCPTCGRELSFIAQYDRYYCYFCQRYAPVARVKGACPTCGATMRWIDQHQRWWCDSCQKYASADLPKPANGAMAASRVAVAATASAVERPAVMVHRHASPAMGMGLIGVGLALWVIYEFFAVLAPATNVAINNPFTPALGAFMVFFAFIFVAGGALLGLSNLRDRL